MQLTDDTFTLLVYPFIHTLTPDDRQQRLDALAHRWQPWWGRLAGEAVDKAVDDTFFFLPHFRQLFFPAAARHADAEVHQVAAALRSLPTDPTALLACDPEADCVLHLTLRPDALADLTPARLRFARADQTGAVVEQFEASLHLPWVDVFLFPQAVGFLVLKVQLDEAEDAFAATHFNDLLYYLRTLHPPQHGYTLAHWERPGVSDPLTFSSRDLVDYLLQGLAAGASPPNRSLAAFLLREQGGARPRYTASTRGQVYGEFFHLFSFACLARDYDRAPEAGEEGTPHDPLFATPSRQVLYELATVARVDVPGNRPHPHGLAALWRHGHVALWDNWEALALQNNVAFLGRRPDAFSQRILPHVVEHDYFYLYLLCLYQKMRLSLFSEEMVHAGRQADRHLLETRRLWDRFIDFRNLYWFAEATRKPQGSLLYQRFRDGLGVFPLFDAVRDELNELQAYYEFRQEQRRQRRDRTQTRLLEVLTLVLLPLTLVFGFFGMNLTFMPEGATWGMLLATLAAVALPLTLLYGLWRRHDRQRADPPAAPEALPELPPSPRRLSPALPLPVQQPAPPEAAPVRPPQPPPAEA